MRWDGKRFSGLTIIIRLFLEFGAIDWGGGYKGGVAKERFKFVCRVGAVSYFQAGAEGYSRSCYVGGVVDCIGNLC